jgi:hypothetical protein
VQTVWEGKTGKEDQDRICRAIHCGGLNFESAERIWNAVQVQDDWAYLLDRVVSTLEKEDKSGISSKSSSK